jgi:hypothetical protein
MSQISSSYSQQYMPSSLLQVPKELVVLIVVCIVIPELADPQHLVPHQQSGPQGVRLR